VEFHNYVAVVTKTSDAGDILFDGKPMTQWSTWRPVANWGFSYTVFAIPHGAHAISVTEGSSALFGAHVYGHSLIDSSSSGYGFATTFDGTTYVLYSPPLL